MVVPYDGQPKISFWLSFLTMRECYYLAWCFAGLASLGIILRFTIRSRGGMMLACIGLVGFLS